MYSEDSDGAASGSSRNKRSVSVDSGLQRDKFMRIQRQQHHQQQQQQPICEEDEMEVSDAESVEVAEATKRRKPRGGAKGDDGDVVKPTGKRAMKGHVVGGGRIRGRAAIHN